MDYEKRIETATLLATRLEAELRKLSAERDDYKPLWLTVGALRRTLEQPQHLWPRLLVGWQDAVMALAGVNAILKDATTGEEGDVH